MLDRNQENTQILAVNDEVNIYGDGLLEENNKTILKGLNQSVVAHITKGTVKTFEYDDYGNTSKKEGHGYNSEYKDETGFIYLRARHYDPSIARFVSVDNNYAGEEKEVNTQNRYVYTLNNPYKYVDRDGNKSVAESISDAFKWLINQFVPGTYDKNKKSKNKKNPPTRKDSDKYYNNFFDVSQYNPNLLELFCHVDGGFNSIQGKTNYKDYIKKFPELRTQFICKSALKDYNSNQNEILKRLELHGSSNRNIFVISAGIDGEILELGPIAAPTLESSFVTSNISYDVYGEIYKTHIRVLSIIVDFTISSSAFSLEKVNKYTSVVIDGITLIPSKKYNYYGNDYYNRKFLYHTNKTFYRNYVEINATAFISPKAVSLFNYGEVNHKKIIEVRK